MTALVQLVALLVEFVTWSLLGLVAHRFAGGGGPGVAAAILGTLVALGASGAWVASRKSRRREAGALALRIVMFGSAAVGLAAMGHVWAAVLYLFVVVGSQIGAALT